MRSHWRTKAAPIIAAVIKEHGTEDMTRLRRELRKAFPFHERKYHPYKIWLDEIRRQLNLKPPLGQVRHHSAPGQLHLFED